MNIILCGLPMCGKSTISKLLAEKLNRSCIDTDHLIEKAFAKIYGEELSCREIYLRGGAAIFRQLEACEILSLMELHDHVIAVGGGSFNDPANVEALHKAGHIVYLKTETPLLWERISSLEDRPAYLNPQDPESDFYTLAKKRMPLYESAAHTIINTGNSLPHAIVNAIIALKGFNHGQ